MTKPLWLAATASNLLLVALLLVTVVVPLVPAYAQSTAVNYIGVNFSPITTSTSYNYDWSAGTLTLGTAAGSVYSTQNVLENSVSDPTPPDPNGYGTFIGTARPVRSPTGEERSFLNNPYAVPGIRLASPMGPSPSETW